MAKTAKDTKKRAADEAGTERLLMSIDDIRTELRCGQAAAYGIARAVGRRLTEKRGRLLVTRRAFERWLDGEVAS